MPADQRIDPSVYLHETARLYGRIEIGAESSIWPNVVIRAEANHVRIGRYTNLQDFVMVHVGYDDPTEIGDFCSITHHTTLHGCLIEDDCLVGINAVVMDGAVIGRGSIVAGGAMVKEGSVFSPGSIIAGVPARQVAERDSARPNRRNAWQYHWNAQAYRRGDHRSWDTPEYAQWIRELAERIERDEDLEGIR
jgi:carbonic anhydrase/acetyltransferase-like protein (isoleucine patch superfamily)